MPAELEDPTQPPHYRPLSGKEQNIRPYTVLLRDGETTATIYPISNSNEVPPELMSFLCDEFNVEIERGETSPLFDILHIDTFQNYWFGSFAGIMLLGDEPKIRHNKQIAWEKETLGAFYIKPNYPGRSSHVCTAGFLVNEGIRNKGIGRTLVECYLKWAPRLGYRYSLFNLVFETNIPATKIFDDLKFKRVGKVKEAGYLKCFDMPVDAIIYGRNIGESSDDMGVGELRFDRIRFYLETGKYPTNAGRLEKSRLRSSSAHYKIENNKLMLKDREVIAEEDRQLKIAREFHMVSHAGINKTTSSITEKYHWTRIKTTVANVIQSCAYCREHSRPAGKVKRQKMDEEGSRSGISNDDGKTTLSHSSMDERHSSIDNETSQRNHTEGNHLTVDDVSAVLKGVKRESADSSADNEEQNSMSPHLTDNSPFLIDDPSPLLAMPVDPQMGPEIGAVFDSSRDEVMARALIEANANEHGEIIYTD